MSLGASCRDSARSSGQHDLRISSSSELPVAPSDPVERSRGEAPVSDGRVDQREVEQVLNLPLPVRDAVDPNPLRQRVDIKHIAPCLRPLGRAFVTA